MTQRLPHPPFCPGPASGIDMTSKEGAERLASLIRAAWRDAGHDVETVVEISSRGRDGTSLWAVRMPGLVNGLPVRSGE